MLESIQTLRSLCNQFLWYHVFIIIFDIISFTINIAIAPHIYLHSRLWRSISWSMLLILYILVCVCAILLYSHHDWRNPPRFTIHKRTTQHRRTNIYTHSAAHTNCWLATQFIQSNTHMHAQCHFVATAIGMLCFLMIWHPARLTVWLCCCSTHPRACVVLCVFVRACRSELTVIKLISLSGWRIRCRYE